MLHRLRGSVRGTSSRRLEAGHLGVFTPLPATHEHQALCEVEVFHAKLAALRHAQASTVNEGRHQAAGASHGPQQIRGRRHAQNDRQMLPPLGSCRHPEPFDIDAEHLPTQEQERAQRLVLRAGGHPWWCTARWVRKSRTDSEVTRGCSTLCCRAT